MSEKAHGKVKRILAGFLIVVAAAVIAFLAYTGDYYHADAAVEAALVSGDAVEVEKQDGMLVFKPEDAAAAGFIFYPGGKVEYTAYVPLMHELAERGVQCVLVEMPFNLAVLDIHAADGIAEQYSDIERWYIGGHSLGGSMAAGYAAERHIVPFHE